MTSSSPRLAAADRLLLREVFAWSRANGFRHTEADPDENGSHARCRVWASKDRRHEVHIWDSRGDDYFGVFVQRDNCSQPLEVLTVREAVDILVALGILPAHFSSAFAAGRESLGQLTEESTKVQYHTTMWFDDGDTDGYTSHGPAQGTPEFEESVVADAARQVGRWDSTCTVVRVETRSYREVTYRADERVLGRFGDWSEVAE